MTDTRSSTLNVHQRLAAITDPLDLQGCVRVDEVRTGRCDICGVRVGHHPDCLDPSTIDPDSLVEIMLKVAFG